MSDETQVAGNTQSTGDAQPGQPAGSDSTLLSGAPGESQTATEGQPAQQSTDAADSSKGEAQGAPERYEFTAPEGAALDDAVIAEFSTVARELNLSQEAAQKVIDKLAPTLAARNAEQIAQTMERASSEWLAAARTDKEFGGDKLDENLAVARKALDAFGSPELRAMLGPFDRERNPQGTGLGNHPEIIRVFYKAGKAISEDRFVPGGVAVNRGERNAAKALYPNQPA